MYRESRESSLPCRQLLIDRPSGVRQKPHPRARTMSDASSSVHLSRLQALAAMRIPAPGSRSAAPSGIVRARGTLALEQLEQSCRAVTSSGLDHFSVWNWPISSKSIRNAVTCGVLSSSPEGRIRTASHGRIVSPAKERVEPVLLDRALPASAGGGPSDGRPSLRVAAVPLDHVTPDAVAAVYDVRPTPM